jgi:hypothetical protein
VETVRGIADLEAFPCKTSARCFPPVFSRA